MIYKLARLVYNVVVGAFALCCLFGALAVCGLVTGGFAYLIVSALEAF